MINKFRFYYYDSFTLSLPPISTDKSVTGTVSWSDGTSDTYVYGSLSHTCEFGETTAIYDTTDFTTLQPGFLAGNLYVYSAEIGEGIVTISGGAFNSCSITNIKLPSSAIVQEYSFTNSTALEEVVFGSTEHPCKTPLSSQNPNAFKGCTALKSIDYYTTDKSLKGTTNSDYFLIEGDTYATVNFIYVWTPPPIITDIPKIDYIIVYDMCETNFTHNGLRILTPISATISEELNGDYSLTLEHYVDDDGAWKSLLEFNIIKACGQLFRIYKKTTKLNSNGLATRTVYAQHIFYDLAHKLIKSCDITGMQGQQALDTIHASIFDDDIDHAYYMYNFQHYSDITTTTTATYELTSPVACLIGEDNSFINRLGGYLYRDNFYYSICSRKEHTQDNAFNIVHGIDMLEVEEVVDYSEFCTYLHTEDNYGNMYAVAYVPNGRFPHNYALGKKFNYNENDIEMLHQDMTSYFEERWTPRITYTVKFANLKNAELYKDFINLANYNVGDVGTIYSEELEINTTQTIIKKVIDAITGETTSITLGNFPRSLTRKEKFSNTITRADNIIDRVVSPYKGVNVHSEAELQSLAAEGKLSKNAVYYDISGDDSV